MLTEKKIACLAVDDEPPALTVIEKYISSVPVLELKASVNNAVDALSILQHNKIDLIFLDIQMPDINGIEFFKTLNSKNIAVIFTTAFSEYAVDGFNVDAIDYLLKPIEYDRFFFFLYKAKEYIEYLNNQELHQGYIFVKAD